MRFRRTISPMAAGTHAGELRRELKLLDVAAIFVGIVLGSGIFVAPSAVAAAAPSTTAGALLWIVGALVAASGALCYAECGARLPRTGGFYVFYREAFGPSVAFVGGWAAVLVTYPASIAAIALVLARYLGEIVPLGGTETAVAAAALLLAGLLNVAGVRIGAGTQKVLTTAKATALAALCVAAVASPRAPVPAAAPAGAGTGAAVLGALVVLLWTYDGWSDITLAAGEIRDPARNLGRAVLLGSATLAALYVLVQVSVTTALSPAVAAGSDRVVADAVEAGLGPAAGRLVAVVVVACTFGSIHGAILTASRLGFAMARDGGLPAWFGGVHGASGTPARATAGLVAAALAYVFAAGFRNLLAFFSFSVWIFYGMTAVALLVLRRRRVGEPLEWRAPGGPAAPAIVLATAVAMTAGLFLQDPGRSAIGLGLLLAGFPVYAAWKGVKEREAPQKGRERTR